MSEELDSYAASLGVTPAPVEEEEDETDPFGAVFGFPKAYLQVPIQYGTIPGTGSVAGGATSSRQADEQIAAAGPRPRQTSLGQLLTRFYAWEPEQLAALQTRLFQGGFYPDAYYKARGAKQVSVGVPDEDSFKAFRAAVVLAARIQLAKQLGVLDGQ